MENFEEEILDDIEWRNSQLRLIKTLSLQYRMRKSHKDFFLRYSIPAIYSIWEGFVKHTFQCYIREINMLRLNASNMDVRLITYAIDMNDQLTLRNKRTVFEKKIKFVEGFIDFMEKDISIPVSLPTESNINYKVLNNILSLFNLEIISDKDLESELNKLLNFRNKIAHGDNNILVKKEDIEDFLCLITKLMDNVFYLIKKGYDIKSFRKQISV